MYSFRNDYSEGAHPSILESLLRTNNEQSFGYGEDIYTAKAQTLIKKHIKRRCRDSLFSWGNANQFDCHFIISTTS